MEYFAGDLTILRIDIPKCTLNQISKYEFRYMV